MGDTVVDKLRPCEIGEYDNIVQTLQSLLMSFICQLVRKFDPFPLPNHGPHLVKESKCSENY